jgi:hypothetical protein
VGNLASGQFGDVTANPATELREAHPGATATIAFDLNQDGVVDVADIFLLLRAWR